MLTIPTIQLRLIFEQLFGYCLLRKGSNVVRKNELELINLVRESANPELVAQYMLNLFLGYLQTHDPSQEKPAAVPLESA